LCEDVYKSVFCDCEVDEFMMPCLSSHLMWERFNMPSSIQLGYTDLAEKNDELGLGRPGISANGLVLAVASPYYVSEGTRDEYPGAVIVWDRRSTAEGFGSSEQGNVLWDPEGKNWAELGRGGVALSAKGLVVAAGAPYTNITSMYEGAIIVWERDSADVPFESSKGVRLYDREGKAEAYLGYGGVSLSADGRVLVGASEGDDTIVDNAGALLVWERSSTKETFTSITPVKLTDRNGTKEEYLGWGGPIISANGLVIAANKRAIGEKDQIVVWTRSKTTVHFSNDITPFYLSDPMGEPSDCMGCGGLSISASGLVLVAATAKDDDQGSNSGSVLVWDIDLSTKSSSQPIKLTHKDGYSGNELGRGGPFISGDGLVLAAASPYAKGVAQGSGYVVVWQRSQPDILFDDARVQISTLEDNDGSSDDWLGYGGLSMSADGTVLVSAAPKNDFAGLTNSGAVVVWDLYLDQCRGKAGLAECVDA